MQWKCLVNMQIKLIKENPYENFNRVRYIRILSGWGKLG